METVRRVYAALAAGAESGDFGAAWDTGDVAPDAVLIPAQEVPGAAEYRGRAGFVEFLRVWTEDFEEWSVRAEQLIDAGHDRVVVFAHQTAIGKGSGAPVDLHFGQVFELRGGRIIRSAIYLDRSEALAAAGRLG